jgi:hypothetical protein
MKADILFSPKTRIYFKEACYHQHIDVKFGVQVRYRLKNDEIEATGKRLSDFNGHHHHHHHLLLLFLLPPWIVT